MTFCGFSVHGVSSLANDLEWVKDADERRRLLQDLGREEARLTHACNGNCMRVFYFPHELLSPLSNDDVEISMLPWSYQGGPWASLKLTEKIEHLARISPWIWAMDEKVASLDARGEGLAFGDLDAYLDGIAAFNASLSVSQSAVQVLLTAVIGAPRGIIELPGTAELERWSIPYRFEDIYGLYCRICCAIVRRIVFRFAPRANEPALICAYELVNEPDYEWIPDEQRIEHARDQGAHPLNKYITEQHREGIPTTFPAPPYASETDWGSFEEQTGGWSDQVERRHVGVLDYPWGPKFDWYLRCYGQLAEAMSFAIADEAARTGQSVEILSGGVTHVNVDYLIRLARAWPAAFKHCTALAIHPYHWPETDIYDTQFVGRQDFTDWRDQDPRTFALFYMKCFDFYKVLIDLVRSGEPPALAGKRIWMTEIGNGSKLWGAHNSRFWQHVPFVRLGRMSADQAPRLSVVWEELWNAFFSMVDPEELKAAGVEALFFYTLRESQGPGLDRHDDDRTNYSFLQRNGLPRLAPDTFRRLQTFMAAMAGKAAPERDIDFPLVPPWTRWRTQSDEMLSAKPWRWGAQAATAEQEARALLTWVTRDYYQGRGRILLSPGACAFSLQPLREGIASSWPEADYEIGRDGSLRQTGAPIEIAVYRREDLSKAALGELAHHRLPGQTLVVVLGDEHAEVLQDQIVALGEGMKAHIITTVAAQLTVIRLH